jgi:hypothetical protein
MGLRLANEVHKYVNDKILGEGLNLAAMSFVGFSLGCGGVLAPACVVLTATRREPCVCLCLGLS